jgi:hypothetical protein
MYRVKCEGCFNVEECIFVDFVAVVVAEKEHGQLGVGVLVDVIEPLLFVQELGQEDVPLIPSATENNWNLQKPIKRISTLLLIG